MKKIYTLLFLLMAVFANAQTINFPDPIFKARLLASGALDQVALNQNNTYLVLDSNNDGELQVNEVQNIATLNLNESGVTDLTGIQYFTNLKVLNCVDNGLTSLNLSPLTNLERVILTNNQLTTLDLSGQTNMKYVYVENNNLTSLNLNGLLNIMYLECQDNQLTALSVSGFSEMSALDCSNNAIQSLSINNATAYMSLNCSHNQLRSLVLTGTNAISTLHAEYNQLTTVDLSSLTNHTHEIYFSFNQLSEIVLPNDMSNLMQLRLNDNQLTAINLNATVNALNFDFHLQNNQITALDCNLQGYGSSFIGSGTLNLLGNPLAHFNLTLESDPNFMGGTFSVNIDDYLSDFQVNGHLFFLNIMNPVPEVVDFSHINASNFGMTDTSNLRELNVKNGSFSSIWIPVNGTPNLQYVCADDNELNNIMQNLNGAGYYDVVYNSYCSFVPGGQFSEITGSTILDVDMNGCDGYDPKMPFAKYTITNGTITGQITANSEGIYNIPVQAGSHTITPVFEHPSYFNASPPSATIPIGLESTTMMQQFCLTANGTHPDLEVVLIPMNNTRPGFDSYFKLVYKNKGNVMLSGTVSFTFDYRSEFISASVTPSYLIGTAAGWDFVNLVPFEQREMTVVVNVNSPVENPAVNSGDILDFSAVVNATDTTDETPQDNSQQLHIIASNSYDPNDKTCLEGTIVSPEQVGKYVHYMIRFENTGTANAENIVVVDQIDAAKFDVSTLVPLDGSHDFHTRINGNKIEFIFENIQLPFDDANNDGYVVFKIKTKPTLVVGDSFSNAASIYFDYNHPIVTDPAVTTVSLLKNVDFEFADEFAIYPNPADDVLNIQSKNNTEIQSVEIYNTLGQLVMATVNAKNTSTIEVSQLPAGNYFLKIHSDKGTVCQKFVKK